MEEHFKIRPLKKVRNYLWKIRNKEAPKSWDIKNAVCLCGTKNCVSQKHEQLHHPGGRSWREVAEVLLLSPPTLRLIAPPAGYDRKHVNRHAAAGRTNIESPTYIRHCCGFCPLHKATVDMCKENCGILIFQTLIDCVHTCEYLRSILWKAFVKI